MSDLQEVACNGIRSGLQEVFPCVNRQPALISLPVAAGKCRKRPRGPCSFDRCFVATNWLNTECCLQLWPMQMVASRYREGELELGTLNSLRSNEGPDVPSLFVFFVGGSEWLKRHPGRSFRH